MSMIHYYVIVVTETINDHTVITGTIGLFTTEEHAIEHAAQVAGPVPNDAVEYHIEPVLPWIMKPEERAIQMQRAREGQTREPFPGF